MYCVCIFFSGVDGPRDVRLSLPNKETTKGTDGDYMDGVEDDDGTMPYVELGLIMMMMIIRKNAKPDAKEFWEPQTIY